MFLYALKNFLSPKKNSPIRRKPETPAFRLESLEDRTVPTTLTVGPGEQYATISAALTAATQYTNPNIDVYPNGGAPYTESLSIKQNGVSLIAEGSVTIQPTPTNVSTIPLSSTVSIGGAAIQVTGTNDLVNGFTVDGSMAGSNLWYGILVDQGGSATIKNNTVENILSPSGATAGSDVAVQIGTSAALEGVTTAGTAKVNSNTIMSYAGAGVVVDGSMASATIKGNSITGIGIQDNGFIVPGAIVPGVQFVSYGVQVSNAATARIQGNTISMNTLTGKAGAPSNNTPTSAGVFVFNDSGKNTVVALNSISMNDDGILVQASNGSNSNDGIQVVNNSVTQNYGYAGIVVLNSTNVEVSCNDVSNNLTYNGIALNGSTNCLISSNDVYSNGVHPITASNAADGIYDQTGTNNSILANNSYSNTGNGINLYATTGDSLFNNVTWNSNLCGVQDVLGTNDAIWLGDSVVNDQDGIRLNGTTKDTIVGNIIALNGGYGINLMGATNTFIALNLIQDNQQGAINQDSATTGTVAIANWTNFPPTKDGSSGRNGSSNSFNSAFADADNACSGLSD